MKKFFLVILTLITSLILCSCGKKVINSVSDELRNSTWTYESNKSEFYASLSFEDENAAFTIDNGNESCTVSGLCVTNDDSIIIIDDEVNKEYLFNYNLIGNSVEIKYKDYNLTFEKE